MSGMKHWMNGRVVGEDELLISARDIGFLRGYAVFDFLITYRNRPFRLEDHIERLLSSAAQIQMSIPFSKDQIVEWVYSALNANEDDFEKSIRIVISGGVGSDSITPSSANPTCIVFIDPHNPYPSTIYEHGTGIILVDHTRYIPGAKSNNYIEGVMRTREARAVDAVEPVYYANNVVFEGATSNIFAVIDGVLRTPKSSVLPGVTRKVLLEILDLPFQLLIDDFTPDDLRRASEVFLTASNKEVMPITAINCKKVGLGQVGEVTKQVMDQFRQYTRSGSW